MNNKFVTYLLIVLLAGSFIFHAMDRFSLNKYRMADKKVFKRALQAKDSIIEVKMKENDHLIQLDEIAGKRIARQAVFMDSLLKNYKLIRIRYIDRYRETTTLTDEEFLKRFTEKLNNNNE